MAEDTYYFRQAAPEELHYFIFTKQKIKGTLYKYIDGYELKLYGKRQSLKIKDKATLKRFLAENSVWDFYPCFLLKR